MKKFASLVAFGLVVAGCAPSYVNLTPRTVPPVASTVYPFEVQWTSPRRGANNANVAANVVIGTNFFPMTRVPNTTDRWEARIPLPPGQDTVTYYYKFDYEYPGLPKRIEASDRSVEYKITLPAK